MALHGLTHEFSVDVAGIRHADGSLRVTTIDSIVLSVDDVELAGGLEKLQQLAGLASIDSVVPVFSLVLR